MKSSFLKHNGIVALLLMLLTFASVGVSAKKLPGKLWGIEIGKTSIKQATEILSNDGRTVKLKNNENIPNCKYLFIYGDDKPLYMWKQLWKSVMYVSMNASNQPITEVFLSTGLMSRSKAEVVFNHLSSVLLSSYGKYLQENSEDCQVYRQKRLELKLSMRKTQKCDDWFVYIQLDTQSGISTTRQSDSDDQKPTDVWQRSEISE